MPVFSTAFVPREPVGMPATLKGVTQTEVKLLQEIAWSAVQGSTQRHSAHSRKQDSTQGRKDAKGPHKKGNEKNRIIGRWNDDAVAVCVAQAQVDRRSAVTEAAVRSNSPNNSTANHRANRRNSNSARRRLRREEFRSRNTPLDWRTASVTRRLQLPMSSRLMTARRRDFLFAAYTRRGAR